MKIHHIPVFCRQSPDSLQHFAVIWREFCRLMQRFFQRNHMTAKKVPQQIVTCIDRNTDKPCFFVFLVFEYNRTQDIFQKNRLKYVLRIMITLQMYHTKSANGICIPLHSSDRLLFTPHGTTSSLICPYGFHTDPAAGRISTGPATANAAILNDLMAACSVIIAVAVSVRIHIMAARSVIITDSVSVGIHEMAVHTVNITDSVSVCIYELAAQIYIITAPVPIGIHIITACSMITAGTVVVRSAAVAVPSSAAMTMSRYGHTTHTKE